TTYRGGPKGHAEEMRALVGLLHGAAAPETDFLASLWSSLATCCAAESLRLRQPLIVEPTTPALRKLLTAEVPGEGP
ncbi:MAG: hypothetical protein M3144_07155, partial [Actinomycetota bacterium]|nr:hypothetical protein [Actinomycetota bacterium]